MAITPLENWIAGKLGLAGGRLSREVLERYQLTMLRQTIAWAQQQSAFYQKRLVSVRPAELATFAQFAELPFTYAQDIKEHPLGLVCMSPKEIERIVTLRSSGTTGEPKRLYFTKADQELTIDFFDYGMRNLVGPADRVLILLPGELPGSVGDLLRIGLERLGACPIPHGIVRDPADAIALALEQGATSMVGIPTQVLGMARHKKGNALEGRIKSVLLSTDHVAASLCRVLEASWGCQSFNHYGMTEMGLGGGVQCSAQQGYHLREADLYFEIVDQRSGQALPEGEMGEVVFTTLTREGMPLIRYRTGDLSRFLPGECACGTVLRSMEIIRQRIAGNLKLAGVDFSLAELDEALFALDGVLDFRAGLTSIDERDLLTIEVKMVEDVPLDQMAVHMAVQDIPAIRNGTATKKLEIRVSGPGQDFPVLTGTAKRTIVDKRIVA